MNVRRKISTAVDSTVPASVRRFYLPVTDLDTRAVNIADTFLLLILMPLRYIELRRAAVLPSVGENWKPGISVHVRNFHHGSSRKIPQRGGGVANSSVLSHRICGNL